MERHVREKLDSRLQAIYDKYVSDMVATDASYNLSLRYQNDLTEIEQLGYETSWKELPGFANGYVKLKNLEAIAAHPNVVSISAGSRQDIKLDKSVFDIKVRTTAPADVGSKGRWFMDSTTGVITAPAGSGLTGKDVIIGIIDTGIDIEHPSFMTGGPLGLKSRILRYWDQGLLPFESGGKPGPDVSLLGVSTKTYGAEFDRTAIETFINGTGNCPSKDCVGHGTHVAGTAAGNGNPGEGIPPTIRKGTYDFAGVAPEADIVVVKYLDTGNAIIDTGLNFVTDRQQFRDAIYYVLKVAKKEGKAAVINCSFGGSLGPHDGLTEEEQFLDALFSPGNEFFNGNVVVIAAGNEAGSRAHARITVPASGEITIPYTLYDVRGTGHLQEYEECRKVDSTRTLFIDIWYKTIPGPDVVSAQVKVPGDAVFSDKLFHGELWKPFDRNKKRTLEHKQEPAVNRPLAGGSTTLVRRSRIRLIVEPSITTNPFQHKTGLYELKIIAPPGTILHTWAYERGPLGFMIGTSTRLTHSAAAGDKKLVVRHVAGFSVNDPVEIELDDGTKHSTTITKITLRELDKDEIEISTGLPSVSSAKKRITGVLPAGILLEDKFLISSNGGAKNVITVASYDDITDTTKDTITRNISSFSSRGPLADYSGLGPYADKPEVAAPGALIKAAKSRHYDGLALNLSELLGNRFVEFRGTSMAAPHIAGLIALMLQKKKTLNVNDVKAIFTNAVNAQDGLKPVPADGVEYTEAFGGGIADGKKAIDAIT